MVVLQNQTEFSSLGKNATTWSATVGAERITLNSSATTYPSIRGFYIGPKITSIGGYFMANCTGLVLPITIPSNVTRISERVFLNCTAYNAKITIEPGVTYIDGFFLSGCSSLNQPITLPNTMTGLGSSFLYNCTALNSKVTLSSKLESISASFMSSCKAFNQDILIPSSLTSLASYFMTDCDNMTSTVTVECPPMASTSNVSYNLSAMSKTVPCVTEGIKITGTYKSQWRSKFPDSLGSSAPYRKLIVV